MDRDTLQKIIDTRDVDQALPVFLRYSENDLLVDLVKSNPQLWGDRIFDELELLLDSIAAEVVDDALPAEPISPTIQAEKTSGDYAELIAQLRDKAKKIFKQMKEVRLGIFSDDYATRSSAALRVLELRKENLECWQKIEFIQTHGYPPQDDTDMDLSDWSSKDLSYQLSIDKKYVYKFRKDPFKEDKVKERQSRIAAIELELAQR